jgi:hypothetical protein
MKADQSFGRNVGEFGEFRWGNNVAWGIRGLFITFLRGFRGTAHSWRKLRPPDLFHEFQRFIVRHVLTKSH